MLGAASAVAQTTQPPPLPRTPDEELKAWKEQLQRTAEILRKAKLPMATEPAFHFKA